MVRINDPSWAQCKAQTRAAEGGVEQQHPGPKPFWKPVLDIYRGSLLDKQSLSPHDHGSEKIPLFREVAVRWLALGSDIGLQEVDIGMPESELAEIQRYRWSLDLKTWIRRQVSGLEV
ncbi:unnamed protein product [Clonostachys solani]|uniref:Uncharacterized protein n=1 Tax=Clonostachys solani TaxID=160281 RepID=A0A9P0ES76_9HYPO|nr:unnamed protein product [Clonostachys solani]